MDMIERLHNCPNCGGTLQDDLDEYGLDVFTFSSFGPTIDFTAEEFREFIDLYQEDINGYDFSKYGIYYDPNFKMSEHWSDFDEVYNNNDPVIIDWG